MNKENEFIIKVLYVASNESQIVKLNTRKMAVMDKDGNLGVERFNQIFMSNFMSRVKLDDNMWTFMDENLKLSTKRYLNARGFFEGLSAVQFNDESWDFIDKNGNNQNNGSATDTIGRFKDADCFVKGFARVKLFDNSWTFVDLNGKLQNGRFLKVNHYRGDYATVQLKNEKWSFVDENGILKFGEFEQAENFLNSLALVKPLNEGKFAFMDKNGILKPGRYASASQYIYVKYASVRLEENGPRLFIDQDGHFVNGDDIFKFSFEKMIENEL